MALDLKTASVCPASILIDITKEVEEPTEPVYAELYFVTLTFPNGKRFEHNFQTRKKEVVERLAKKIQANVTKVNLKKHWTETQPVYGSDAYVAGGGDFAYTMDEEERNRYLLGR